MSHTTRCWWTLAVLCLSVLAVVPLYALLRALGIAAHVPDTIGTIALAAACFTGGFAVLSTQADAANTREGTA